MTIVSFSRIVQIAHDIGQAAERNDEFPYAGNSGRTATTREDLERPNGPPQDVDCMLCGRFFLVIKKGAKPLDVSHRLFRDDKFHSLRDLGGGSSFVVPQLLIQDSTSAHGMPSPVR
jgi:hypothetical protein